MLNPDAERIYENAARVNDPLPYNCPVCKCPDSVNPWTDRCDECGVQLIAAGAMDIPDLEAE